MVLGGLGVRSLGPGNPRFHKISIAAIPISIKKKRMLFKQNFASSKWKTRSQCKNMSGFLESNRVEESPLPMSILRYERQVQDIYLKT